MGVLSTATTNGTLALIWTSISRLIINYIVICVYVFFSIGILFFGTTAAVAIMFALNSHTRILCASMLPKPINHLGFIAQHLDVLVFNEARAPFPNSKWAVTTNAWRFSPDTVALWHRHDVVVDVGKMIPFFFLFLWILNWDKRAFLGPAARLSTPR